MNYIGEKIKELRRKNDMTQEKLADYLGVTYQTVSKWETGITSPDLSLIVPLARLFKVTTDELFCFNENADYIRNEELEAEYRETWKNGDLKKRFETAQQAVNEYPGDMKWLDRLAWAQAMRSFEYSEDEDKYAAEQEGAIKRFAVVIENASDEKIRASSVQGIVQYLSFRGREDEAKRYAQLYPENYSVSKDDILLSCLRGEEKIVHSQRMLDTAMLNLLNLLGNDSDLACDAQEQILKVLIPDQNYLYYHCFLSELYRKRALFRVRDGNSGVAVQMLKKAVYHADEYDKIFSHSGMYRFTSPFFDRVEYNTEDICKSGSTTQAEDLFETLKNSAFDPIRERGNFKDLFKSGS
ncbi:MAG: helix-turn-helix transcriptional regulator [Lachnospiraceae bacterium]|nr:helix-turn-helix transcriptional regulator [Lachnospiraceae bacterium]